MDRDQLMHSAKHWYPIIAAILSSILNFVSFMIGINWDSKSIIQISIVALLGTMAFSGLVVYILYRISKSSYLEELTILTSTDDYKILDFNHTIYRKTVSVRVNKPTTFIILYPPSADGEVQEYKAYHINNPQIEYDIHLQRVSGRRALFLNIGRPLRKGEVLDGICVECKLINSFQSEHEGISIATDPGQEKCMIKISLPNNIPPIPLKADWFVLSGRNQSPIKNGSVDVYQTSDNNFIIDHDFSHYLSNGIGLQCSISWRWKPNCDSQKNIALGIEQAT